MAKTYKVTAPTKDLNHALWGVAFSNGVAKHVEPGIALDSFRNMGYRIEPEREGSSGNDTMPRKPNKKPTIVDEIKAEVEAAKSGD